MARTPELLKKKVEFTKPRLSRFADAVRNILGALPSLIGFIRGFKAIMRGLWVKIFVDVLECFIAIHWRRRN